MTQRQLHILTISFIIVLNIAAQQKPLFSHYMFNKYSINPGVAGSNEMVSLTSVIRNQWQGIEGAPTTYSFNVNAPVKILGIQSGIGFDAVQDKLGFNADNGIKIGYTMRFNVGTGKLAFGFMGGIINPTIKPDWSVNENVNNGYGTIVPGEFDPPEGYEDKIKFDMDVGVYYHTDDLYFGISSVRLNAPELNFSSGTGTSLITEIYDLKRHYYLITGYNMFLSNPAFEIRPSFIIETDGVSMSFDINGLLVYNKKVWGGVSYRNAIASYLIGMIGLELIENLKVGFAYDVPTPSFINFTGGTIEVMLNYNFSLSVEKTTQKYKSIRYL